MTLATQVKISVVIGLLVIAGATIVGPKLWARRTSAVTLKGCPLEFEYRTLDIGTLTAGKPLEIKFQFKNPTSQILRIGHSQTSCGCIQQDGQTKATIAPSERGELVFKVDTFNKSGHFNVKIIPTVNEHAAGEALDVTGVLESTPVYLSPPQIVFSPASIAVDHQQQVILRTLDGSPIKISRIESSDSHLKVIPPESADGRMVLPVKLDKGFPATLGREWITIHVQEPTELELKLNVKIVPVAPIIAKPSSLLISGGSSASARDMIVSIQSTAGRPFQIKTVQTPAYLIVEPVQSISSGSAKTHFDYKIRINSSLRLEKSHVEKIRFITDDLSCDDVVVVVATTGQENQLQ